MVDDIDGISNSGLACAYSRARGADVRLLCYCATLLARCCIRLPKTFECDILTVERRECPALGT